MQKLLTREEAAETLRISVWTLSNFVRAGELRYVKLGRATLFKPTDIDELIENSSHREPQSRSTSRKTRRTNSSISSIKIIDFTVPLAKRGKWLK